MSPPRVRGFSSNSVSSAFSAPSKKPSSQDQKVSSIFNNSMTSQELAEKEDFVNDSFMSSDFDVSDSLMELEVSDGQDQELSGLNEAQERKKTEESNLTESSVFDVFDDFMELDEHPLQNQEGKSQNVSPSKRLKDAQVEELNDPNEAQKRRKAEEPNSADSTVLDSSMELDSNENSFIAAPKKKSISFSETPPEQFIIEKSPLENAINRAFCKMNTSASFIPFERFRLVREGDEVFGIISKEQGQIDINPRLLKENSYSQTYDLEIEGEKIPLRLRVLRNFGESFLIEGQRQFHLLTDLYMKFPECRELFVFPYEYVYESFPVARSIHTSQKPEVVVGFIEELSSKQVMHAPIQFQTYEVDFKKMTKALNALHSRGVIHRNMLHYDEASSLVPSGSCFVYDKQDRLRMGDLQEALHLDWIIDGDEPHFHSISALLPREELQALNVTAKELRDLVREKRQEERGLCSFQKRSDREKHEMRINEAKSKYLEQLKAAEVFCLGEIFARRCYKPGTSQNLDFLEKNNPQVPRGIKKLIRSMLNPSFAERPTALKVQSELSRLFPLKREPFRLLSARELRAL